MSAPLPQQGWSRSRACKRSPVAGPPWKAISEVFRRPTLGYTALQIVSETSHARPLVRIASRRWEAMDVLSFFVLCASASMADPVRPVPQPALPGGDAAQPQPRDFLGFVLAVPPVRHISTRAPARARLRVRPRAPAHPRAHAYGPAQAAHSAQARSGAARDCAASPPGSAGCGTGRTFARAFDPSHHSPQKKAVGRYSKPWLSRGHSRAQNSRSGLAKNANTANTGGGAND